MTLAVPPPVSGPVLRDGTQVAIRRIRPADKDVLSAALHDLSDLSVHRRFLAPKRTFTASELRYLTEVDGHDHVALVAELPGVPDRLAGVARYVRYPDDPAEADFAIVVGDPLQGLGLGSLLADELAQVALANGIERFSATMLSDNAAAQRLLSRLSRTRLELVAQGAGSRSVVARLAA